MFAALARPSAPLAVERAEVAADAAMSAFVALREAARQAASAAHGSADWTGAGRAAALEMMDMVAGVLATARGALLLAERDAGTSQRVGDRDFVAARARITRAGLGTVHREVRQAQTLADLPGVAAAVAQGQVPVGHVDALARVVVGAGEAAAAVIASPERQAEIVELGSRLPERAFAARVAQLVAAHDPASVQAGFDAQHAARFFTMTATGDGVMLKGRLDRVAGERLRVALDATGIGPDEHRDSLQARADALVAVAERSLSGQAGIRPRARLREPGETDARAAERDAAHAAAQDAADHTVSGTANRPHISLIVPAETFAAVREEQRRRDELGHQSLDRQGRHCEEDDEPSAHRAHGRPEGPREHAMLSPATLEDGTPLPYSELARALCDASVSRIVIDADGLPMDLGRSTRLYSGALRRAVIVRDRGCAWNGCTTTAAYCEVHHIRWWRDDHGVTSVENGVLLCSFHHHLVHRLELGIHREPPERTGRRAGSGLGHEPPRYTFWKRRDGVTVNEAPRRT